MTENMDPCCSPLGVFILYKKGFVTLLLQDKTYMIPGTNPEASPAGFPPLNHFLAPLK